MGITDLYKLQQKKVRTILGLMSGTSLDGLDIALCSFSGYGFDTQVSLKHFITQPYTENFKNQIRQAFSKKTVNLEHLTMLHAYIGRIHASLINDTLKKWGIESHEIDLIASHGQTIYHAPASLHQVKGLPDATLQMGDGDHIAVGTGIITISDFRQKHVAAGGEGAPLAAYGDILLFSSKDENRVLLNIGGISNFSFLPAQNSKNQFISTDAGPGNTLMDAFVRLCFGKNYDDNAAIARSGRCNLPLLTALSAHPFFNLDVPKTTGPELFNLEYLQQARQESGTQHIPDEDVLATLNRFTAESIAKTIRQCMTSAEPFTIYASGGGTKNPLLLENIKEVLPGTTVKSTASLGIDPSAKEAVLFAALANECIAPEKFNFRSSSKMPDVRMGKISLPD